MNSFLLRCLTLCLISAAPAATVLSQVLPKAELPGTTPSDFHWRTGAPVILPKSDATHAVDAIKDPTVVFANGKYHVIMTTAGNGGWSMASVSFKDWADAASAPFTYLDGSGIGKGYRCAPQVFYFAPQRLWYLVFQEGDPFYATTSNIDDPLSWSAPKPFFDHAPAVMQINKGKATWLDFWNICDEKKCYLFNTDDNGHFFRSETSIKDFPTGYGKSVLVMESAKPGYLFEAGMTYKVAGTNKFVTMIEAAGPHGRYFRSWQSDRLDGTWQPLDDTMEHPFAGANFVTYDGPRWSEDISHGELIRAGDDQTLTIDPCKPVRVLYQGREPKGDETDYIKLPYRLGLLTAEGNNPISAMCPTERK